jgi:tetratricopeptide (TPR) repeat protein
VSASSAATPVLTEMYARYLSDENTAAFIGAVSRRYMIGTLERLAEAGRVSSRRAATLAIALVGTYESNEVLGRLMHDRDRCVRLLAENGIRDLWMRDGSEEQQSRLKVLVRLNGSQQFDQAVEGASELIEDCPTLAEAWNQRAIGLFQLDRYEESANDCHQALEINPYHFGAAVGMAHCYLELNDAYAALECFRRALRICPDMEEIRAQADQLERMLEGK